MMSYFPVWCRRPGCLLAMAILLGSPMLGCWAIWSEFRAWYWEEVVAILPSPTGAWTARVVEHIMEGGMAGLSEADDVVELTSALHPGNPIELLRVIDIRDNRSAPRLAWTAHNVLQITVKTSSAARLLVDGAAGVKVELQLDQDDSGT